MFLVFLTPHASYLRSHMSERMIQGMNTLHSKQVHGVRNHPKYISNNSNIFLFLFFSFFYEYFFTKFSTHSHGYLLQDNCPVTQTVS